MLNIKRQVLLKKLFVLLFLLMSSFSLTAANFPDKEPFSDIENPFEKFYFYENDKLLRYVTYKENNLDLTDEEVVWRVNSNLDKPFYSEIETITDTSNPAMVVNKYNKLPEDFIPQNLVKLPSGRQISEDAGTYFAELLKDATLEGLSLREVSAYRSINYQKNLYNRYLKSNNQAKVDTFSARAGHSEHNLGRALDLCGSNGIMNKFYETKEYAWIEENAYKYGFIIRYPKGSSNITGYIFEAWHISYIGVDASTTMFENNIQTLEEYKVKYIDHYPEEAPLEPYQEEEQTIEKPKRRIPFFFRNKNDA